MHRAVSILAVLLLASACSSPRSYAQLAADADAVPVPAGVLFVGQQQSLNDGPGFTTTKSEEVARQFRTSLPCSVLEDMWASALRAAHRRFRLANHPHSFGATGSLGIQIDDRPEQLGITLGTDDGYCAHPFVYSFNSPH